MPYRVLLVVAALLLPATSSIAHEKPALEQALEAFKKGEYEQAVELASKVPAEAEDYARARYLAGEAHLKLADASAAEKAFRAALALRPKSVPIIVGLGRALEARGRLEDAEKRYREAIKLDRKSAAAKRALGELQMRQDDLGKARSTLRAAHKLAPKDPLCVRALAECLLRGGDAKGADKLAKALVKARPEHPMGYFLRGLVFERKGKLDDAIDHYDQALTADKRFIDAHKNLAILYHTNNPGYEDMTLVRKALHHYEEYFGLGGKDEALKATWRRFQRFVTLELEEDEEEEEDE